MKQILKSGFFSEMNFGTGESNCKVSAAASESDREKELSGKDGLSDICTRNISGFRKAGES